MTYLKMTYWSYFQTAKKFFFLIVGRNIFKKRVTNGHQKQALYYILSAVPKRSTKSKLTGYFLGTYIFENSTNLKNLESTLLTFIAFCYYYNSIAVLEP